MKILNPDRNTTGNLWRRLESGAALPVVLVPFVISISNMLQNMNASPVWRISVFAFLFLIAVGCMSAQMRVVKELKKRNSETSNTNLEPISGSQ
jgi:hypothetical protein